jgi:arabinogalactan oligomer/maltooligosaccharide transport system permease protein
VVDEKIQKGGLLNGRANIPSHLLGTVARATSIILLSLFAVLPIFFVLSVSLSGGGELHAGNLIPRTLTLENYRVLFYETDFFIWVKNSLIVAGTTALIALFITSLTAYTLSRFPFRGRDLMTSSLLVIQLFPGILSLVAVYKILQFFHLLDTHAALVLVYLAGAVPFTTWMIKGFLDTVPRTVEEAAVLDGAQPLTVYTLIVLPLSIPILLVVFAFNFIAAYSDFLMAAVVLTDTQRYTLALGLRSFLEGDFSTNWPVFSAAALCGSIPIIIMFLVIMRYGFSNHDLST